MHIYAWWCFFYHFYLCTVFRFILSVNPINVVSLCVRCNFMNFAKNAKCRSCGEDGPKGVSRSDDSEMKKGDWLCSG